MKQGTTRSAAATSAESRRLHPISAKVEASLRDEIDAYAQSQGITRSRATSEYLTIAREALRERDGIPSGRADEVLEVLEGLHGLVHLLGPPTLGILRLLAHWAAKAGALKVSEDELLAEVRTVSADEWEQAVAEAERELQEARRQLSAGEKS